MREWWKSSLTSIELANNHAPGCSLGQTACQQSASYVLFSGQEETNPSFYSPSAVDDTWVQHCSTTQTCYEHCRIAE